MFRTIRRSLVAKLTLSLGILIVVGGGISWYTLISTSKRDLMKATLENAEAYSDLVRKSTRYSMLTFHREAIQETIAEIGSRRGIEGLRIFNSSGKITYAADHEEIGRQVERRDPVCSGCHSEPAEPAQVLVHERRWLIHANPGGRVLTFIEPLYNEPACTASCHPQRQKVLGMIQTDFSLAELDSTTRRQTVETSLFSLALMATSALALYFVLERLVLNPLAALDTAMEKVTAGKLEQSLAIPSEDEMGRLAATFNAMTRELADAREKMEDWTRSLEQGIAKKTEELKRSQDKLIQAEKLASLGRLTADVAHEIRNPLTSVGGFARRLLKIATEERQKEYAKIIVTEADRLEKILKDVLTFSRDARSHLERHGIAVIVRETLKLYAGPCRDQAIEIEVTIGEDLLPVMIDREQVSQALGNLITNAVDAMPEGGRLSVTAGREEHHGVTYMFMRVTDSGPGMPPEVLPLIFEPFVTTKNITHGTGLGLSITRKIMEEHGGFINAESREGHGSSFTIYFPYQSEQESPLANCWEQMHCGRDTDCSLKCPAYPHFGRVCWVVAGTFCEGKIQGTFAQKYEDCLQCEFYKKSSDRPLAASS